MYSARSQIKRTRFLPGLTPVGFRAVTAVENAARGALDFVVGGIQDVVPTAIQAVLVLLVGLVVSVFFGRKAYELGVRFAVGDRVRVPGLDRRDDTVSSALSTFVRYLGIAITLLLTIGVLDIHTVGCKSFPDFAGSAGEIPVNSYNRPYQELQALNQTLLAYAPRLLAAALVAVEYYIYLVTLFVVVDVLRVGPLRELAGAASFYAPALVAGGAVLVAAVVALDVAGVSTQLLVTVLHVVVLLAATSSSAISKTGCEAKPCHCRLPSSARESRLSREAGALRDLLSEPSAERGGRDSLRFHSARPGFMPVGVDCPATRSPKPTRKHRGPSRRYAPSGAYSTPAPATRDGVTV